jgi:hypothetical protein
VSHAKALTREVKAVLGDSARLRKKQKVIPGLLVVSSTGRISSLLAADFADRPSLVAGFARIQMPRFTAEFLRI